MKLNKSNYFSLEANRHYMSVSQFKDFTPAYGGCEAKAMAKLTGEYEEPHKEAFIEGHYVHAWNEGTLDEFKANNPNLYSTRGKTAGQLKANFQHCNKMIEVLENDEKVMLALSGEKEVILTAELFDIPWKIMIDSYNPKFKVFTDLKTARSMDSKFWNNEVQVYENFIEHFGYLVQVSIYAEVERIAQGRPSEDWFVPHMVIVTKQDPPDHEVVYFDEDLIRSQLLIVEKHIERVKQVKNKQVKPNRCESCEYCRATKKIQRIKHYSEFDLY